MKTVLKVVGGILLGIVALAATGLSWLALRKPAARPVSSLRVDPTPARLARGKYIVEHVADCLGCHSDHLDDRYGFPVKAGTEGQGGFVFDAKLGIPGVVCAQNITPDPETGIGRWSDDEVLRAMREGVDREGNALFPMMPYVHLREMSDFPVNLIIKFTPKPITSPVSAPDSHKDRVAYGRYLTKIGGCYECHTPHDEKQQLEGMIDAWFEDRGETWQAIGQNLPPVYSVRFA